MLIVNTIEWRWSCTGISDVWENPTCFSDLFPWQFLTWPSRASYTAKLRIWSCVVWLIVQEFDDFQTGLNFSAQQSGCVTVWSGLKYEWTCLRAVVPQSPVHRWFSYWSHLLFKMSHTTANKEFWREFIQLYRLLPELWTVKIDVYKTAVWRMLATTNHEKLKMTLTEIWCARK